MSKTIIGLTGGIGTGKSTVARILSEKYDFERVSFAAKIKQVCLDVFGGSYDVPVEAFAGTQEEKALPRPELDGMSGRRVTDLLGTEVCRSILPDVWTRYGMRCAEESTAPGVVFDDARYPSEFDAIREAGGVLVRCVVAGEEPPRTGHESDEHWRDLVPDHIIYAPRGGIEVLEWEACSMLTNLSLRRWGQVKA